MSQPIAVRLPDELLAEFDALIAARGFDSRADGVRSAVEAYVVQLRRDEIDRQLIDGYRQIPQSQADSREFFQAIDDEPWDRPW
jgi:metal-responsive CopG/Arc/MetJ family transcriptional regulator